jgi:hypothetical protein
MRFGKKRAKSSQILHILTLSATALISLLGFSSAAFASSPPPVISEPFAQNAGTMSVVSGGTWEVTGGVYQLTTPAIAQSGNGNLAVSSTPLTGDFTITIDGKAVNSGGEFSVIFDYSDPQNYSYAHFSSTLHDFSQGIYKVQAGTVNQVAAYDSAVPVGTAQTVKVKYEGGKVKAYKGTTYLTGLTMGVRGGALIGLGTVGNDATFDNLSVTGTVASARIEPLPQVTPQPLVTPPAAPAACANFQPRRSVSVVTANDLTDALAAAQPGDDIQLSDGTYLGNFTIAADGTTSQPIRLSGSAAAILDAGSVDGSPVLHLDNASNWCIDGFAVTDGNKGIMADSSTDNVLQNLDVYNIGDEGVHFRSCSTNNIIQNSHIHQTGQRRNSFGEGVYLGTADSNWAVYNYCDLGNPDQSNYNRVLNNAFDNTAAEAVDVKEGTMGGIIQGNRFDGVGMSGNHANSLIDVKGANYSITGNTVTVSGPSTVVDGFQTHVIAVRTDVTHSGTGNTFSGNTMTLGGVTGYGINIGAGSTALVTCDNVVTGAALGMSNTACRP